MEWFVYCENINRRRIEPYNIFNHSGFLDDCKNALRKYTDNKEGFLRMVRSSLRYYYWSKCEWEIVLSDYPPSDSFKAEKIDVYSQVVLNWGVFSEYIWENRIQLKKMRV